MGDLAEEEPERAFAVNREGARNLAVACRDAGIPLFHISTDYVFDGEKSAPYTEEDSPNPCSVYGRSKFEGEQAVAQIVDNPYLNGTVIRLDGALRMPPK